MKMREEIDALRVMALDPVEVLVLPRILALVVAMLVLSVIGDIASLVGGGLVCWFYGGINPPVFIATLKNAVTLNDFLAGVIKAPFMAVAIGVVAMLAAASGQRAAWEVDRPPHHGRGRPVDHPGDPPRRPLQLLLRCDRAASRPMAPMIARLAREQRT